MENQILVNLIENYKLSEKEHKIILEKLKANIFLNRTKNKITDINKEVNSRIMVKMPMDKALVLLHFDI